MCEVNRLMITYKKNLYEIINYKLFIHPRASAIALGMFKQSEDASLRARSIFVFLQVLRSGNHILPKNLHYTLIQSQEVTHND